MCVPDQTPVPLRVPDGRSFPVPLSSWKDSLYVAIEIGLYHHPVLLSEEGV